MAEIFIFNHIKKTAGSTLRHVLYGVYGGRRIHSIYAYPTARLPTYGEHIAYLQKRLSAPDPQLGAIISHAGYGFHEQLPDQHCYRLFTVLRDPVQRTISIYHFARQNGSYPANTPLDVFLQDTERAYNTQTADIGGLMLTETVGGRPLRREDYDDALLERAKANLLAHDAFGIAERFDESLLLAADVFGWPQWKLPYVTFNVGTVRKVRPPMKPEQLDLIREHNQLDLALYAFATERFEQALQKRLPDYPERIRAFERLQRLYALSAPRARARIRAKALQAAHALGLRKPHASEA